MSDFLVILFALGASFCVGAVTGSLIMFAGVKAGAKAAAGYDDDAEPTPPLATGDGRK